MHDLSKARFRALFVVIPLFTSSVVPTMIFGLAADQWGTNLLWGSYFGLGWCLAALWSGNVVHDHLSTALGLIWGWLALIPLYFASGWLWVRTTVRVRKIAVGALGLSAVLMVPAKAVMDLDQRGVHLPDYASHLATSF